MSRFDKMIESFFSEIKNKKLILLFNVRYFYKIFRLLSIALIMTYFVGCFWYMYCEIFSHYYEEENFIKKNDLKSKNSYEKLIITIYFTLSTLTTVGYGDYFAVNNYERIFAILIMLLGVAMFSYVMGSFTELISSYEKIIGDGDKDSELHNWLSVLEKFSKNKPFEANLIGRIDKHFAYFWKNDRNSFISKDDPYLLALPKNLKIKVLEYLWGDTLLKFSNCFQYYTGNKGKYFKFYYDICFSLMPRRFFPYEYIYKANEDIEEMYLISHGTVQIGYSLHEEDTFIKYCKTLNTVDWIGDFYCLFNVNSKYYYIAKNEVKTFGINKYDLLKMIEKYPSLYAKMRIHSHKRYSDYIKFYLEKNIDTDIKIFNLNNTSVKMNKLDHSDGVNFIFIIC
jgi:hypothetical protein